MSISLPFILDVYIWCFEPDEIIIKRRIDEGVTNIFSRYDCIISANQWKSIRLLRLGSCWLRVSRTHRRILFFPFFLKNISACFFVKRNWWRWGSVDKYSVGRVLLIDLIESLSACHQHELFSHSIIKANTKRS